MNILILLYTVYKKYYIIRVITTQDTYNHIKYQFLINKINVQVDYKFSSKLMPYSIR